MFKQSVQVDAVVVGAGFAGMYMLHRLRGLGLTVRVIEAADDIGGTWYWNRYPGARCDVESMQYSYSFDEALQQDWEWTERFATQPEILRYAHHVAERFDLRRDIQFGTRVTGATWDGARWTIETDRGERIAAGFCIMATGSLSAGKLPEIEGTGSFAGRTYHTGAWPHEGVDFTGQRVGVIGTGSSAIQSIPEIARQAAALTVFQRTPNFSVPAHNRPLDPGAVQDWKANYPAHRQHARTLRSGIIYDFGATSALVPTAEKRDQEYASRWDVGGINLMATYTDLLTDADANETAAEFVRSRIRHIVQDPATAAALQPHGHPIGTKRICVDTGYYATFNQPHVRLVDLRQDPVLAITPTGVRTRSAEHALDSLVFATGFDAMTGALLRINIRGTDGLALADAWADGPRSYLGLMVAGFPNLFTITGPGSPSVLSNMIVSIEQHVDWISDCLAYLHAHGMEVIAASAAAQEAWVAHGAAVAAATLYPRANSWYMGANVAGKPQVFMPYCGGVGPYREHCAGIAARGYEGFTLTPRQHARAAE